MERICAGVIGFGPWGEKLVDVLKRSGQYRVIAVADTDDAARRRIKAAGVKAVASAAEILNDRSIQFVVIATPPASHRSLVSRALAAKKHVYCAKPLARTADEAQELVSLAREKRRLLAGDQVAAHVPGVRKLIELTQKGSIGKPYFVRTSRLNFGAFRRDVGVVWDLAPHDFSILDELWPGDKPRVLSCVFSGRTAGPPFTSANVHLQYSKSREAMVFVSWLASSMCRELLVVGDRGMLCFRETRKARALKLYKRSIHRLTDDSSLYPSSSLGHGRKIALRKANRCCSSSRALPKL